MGRMRKSNIPQVNPFVGSKEEIEASILVSFNQNVIGESNDIVRSIVHFIDGFETAKMILDIVYKFFKVNGEGLAMEVKLNAVSIIDDLYQSFSRDPLFLSYLLKYSFESEDYFKRVLGYYAGLPASLTEAESDTLLKNELDNKENPLSIQISILHYIRENGFPENIKGIEFFDYFSNILEKLKLKRTPDANIAAGIVLECAHELFLSRSDEIYIGDLISNYLPKYLRILSKFKDFMNYNLVFSEFKKYMYVVTNYRFMSHEKTGVLKDLYLDLLSPLVHSKCRKIIKVLQEKFTEESVQERLLGDFKGILGQYEIDSRTSPGFYFWNLFYLRNLSTNSQYVKDNVETIFIILMEIINLPNNNFISRFTNFMQDEYEDENMNAPFIHNRYAVEVIERYFEEFVVLPGFVDFFESKLQPLSAFFVDPFSRLKDPCVFIDQGLGGFKKAFKSFKKTSSFILLNSLVKTRKVNEMTKTLINQVMKIIESKKLSNERYALLDCIAEYKFTNVTDYDTLYPSIKIDRSIQSRDSNTFELYIRGIRKIYDKLGKNVQGCLTYVIEIAASRSEVDLLKELCRSYPDVLESVKSYIPHFQYHTKDLLALSTHSNVFSSYNTLYRLYDIPPIDIFKKYLEIFNGVMAYKSHANTFFYRLLQMGTEEQSCIDKIIPTCVQVANAIIDKKLFSRADILYQFGTNNSDSLVSPRCIIPFYFQFSEHLYESSDNKTLKLFNYAVEILSKTPLKLREFQVELIKYCKSHNIDIISAIIKSKKLKLLPLDLVKDLIKDSPKVFQKIPNARGLHQVYPECDELLDKAILEKVLQTPLTKGDSKKQKITVPTTNADTQQQIFSDYILKYILTFLIHDPKIALVWKIQVLPMLSWKVRTQCSDIISYNVSNPSIVFDNYKKYQIWDLNNKYSLVKNINYSSISGLRLKASMIPEAYQNLKTLIYTVNPQMSTISPYFPQHLEELVVTCQKSWSIKITESNKFYFYQLLERNKSLKKLTLDLNSNHFLFIEVFSKGIDIILRNNPELQSITLRTTSFPGLNSTLDKIRRDYSNIRLFVQCIELDGEYLRDKISPLDPNSGMPQTPSTEALEKLHRDHHDFVQHCDYLYLSDIHLIQNVFQHMNRVKTLKIFPLTHYEQQDGAPILPIFKAFAETTQTLRSLKFFGLNMKLYDIETQILSVIPRLEKFSLGFINSTKNDSKVLNEYFAIIDKHPRIQFIKINYKGANSSPLTKLNQNVFLSKLQTCSFKFVELTKHTLKFDRVIKL